MTVYYIAILERKIGEWRGGPFTQSGKLFIRKGKNDIFEYHPIN